MLPEANLVHVATHPFCSFVCVCVHNFNHNNMLPEANLVHVLDVATHPFCSFVCVCVCVHDH